MDAWFVNKARAMTERMSIESLSDVRPTASLFGFVTEVAEVENVTQGRSKLEGALERCKLEFGRAVTRWPVLAHN